MTLLSNIQLKQINKIIMGKIMRYTLLFLFFIPNLALAQEDFTATTLKTVFCQKSIDCGEKFFKTVTDCVAQMPEPIPNSADLKVYGPKIKACCKAIQKNTCEAVQKAAPEECKFLDDFGSEKN